MHLLIQQKKKWKLIHIGLILGLFLTVIIATTLGTVNIGFMESVRMVIHNIPLMDRYIDVSHIPKNHLVILQDIRLPRILLSVLVGIILSVSGVTFQGMLKNPMADPFIIGISSGAALGATIGIVLKIQGGLFGINSISVLAFLGALITTFLVYSQIGRAHV